MFLLPPLTEDVAFLTFEPLFGPSTSSKRSNVSGLGSRYEPYRRPDASSTLFSLSSPVGSNHSSAHYDSLPLQVISIAQARRMNRRNRKAADKISEEMKNMYVSQSSEEDEVHSPSRQSKPLRSPLAVRGGSFDSASPASSSPRPSTSPAVSSSLRARGSSFDAGSSYYTPRSPSSPSYHNLPHHRSFHAPTPISSAS